MIDIKEIIQQLGVRVDLIVILLGLMATDIFAGVVKAFYLGEFQSKILREGLIKKLFEIVIIVIGYVLDYVLNLKQIGVAVSLILIGAETYSIVIENASTFVPIPKVLKNAIDTLKSEDDKNEEEEQYL